MSELVNVSIDETTELVTVTIAEDTVSAGDMRVATYDPQAIAADAFDRANHTGVQPLSSISDAGTAAAFDVGTDANNVIQLDESAKLPAVDGSQLINLPGSGAAVDSVNGFVGNVVLDADDISDTFTTNKFTTATQITKLSTIQTGATANDTNAALRDRATHTGSQTISTVTGLQSALDGKEPLLGFAPENSANKNANSGYCGLDSGGKVPLANLPSTLLQYQGTWNASTNTPTLVSPDLAKIGWVYNVSVAGTQFSLDFSLGDWLIYNASGIPEKSDNSDDVVSVNGQTGTIVLDADDIDDTATVNKFVTATDVSNLVDLTDGGETTLHTHDGRYYTETETDTLLSGKIDTDGNNGAITYTNFVASAAPTYQEGRVWYDADTDSISYYDNHAGTSVQVGKELIVTARNNSGGAIANGQAVYISGATGQNPTIALARADSLTTAEIIGVATHDIANNTTGKVTVFGLINDFDTSAFTDGQQVYLSAVTPGLLTATPPVSPNFVVFVGYIAHAHVSQGKLLVMSDRAMANDNSLGTSQISFPTQNAVKEYVDGITDAITEGLTIVQTSLATLNPTPGNYYLVDGTTTVNLPAGSNGDVIGIADGASNFEAANCTINPNGAQTIAGEIAVTLTADNAFIVLAFWGTRWTIIHGNSFIPVAEAQPTNVLINGAFAIDQRNNGAAQTITAAAAKVYPIDRWYAYCTGANVTGQRVAGSAQSQYRYRFTGAASNTEIQFGQRIEAANSYHLNGQSSTLSVDLASSSITTVAWTAYYANTTDTFGTIASPTRTQIATGNFTITSSIARYSAQIAIPLAATTGIEIVFSVNALLGSQTWTIGNAQLEIGTVPTSFEMLPITQIETACRRRFRKLTVAHKGAGFTSGGQYASENLLYDPMAETPVFSSGAGKVFTSAASRAATASANLSLAFLGAEGSATKTEGFVFATFAGASATFGFIAPNVSLDCEL
jgi:hypothetical protein